MPNFVMLNLPNFVLVETATGLPVEPWPEEEPVHLNPQLNEILRVLGVRMRTCAESDRLAFRNEHRPLMQPVLDRYGFERLPRTVGELGGLFEYCDKLDALTGAGMFTGEQLVQWQRLSLQLCPPRHGLPTTLAVELYRRGDREALCSLHAEQDTLTVLGRAWRFVPGR